MKRTGKVAAIRVHSIDRDNMDIGPSLWMRDIDKISHQIEEGLSLEGVVVTQRATELQSEAQKVYFNTGINKVTARTIYQNLIPRSALEECRSVCQKDS